MKVTGRIPGVVMAWTMIFMTFTWTPTMRALLKPEVSNWRVFELQGSGLSLSFLLIPFLAIYALFLFYLYGRGKLRVVFHVLLLALHVPVTLTLLVSAARQGPDARFIGAAWGFDFPFTVLSIPFVLFTGLAVAWFVADVRGRLEVQEVAWGRIGWKKLLLAAALLPVAMLFFALGEGYDGWSKVAIVVTILQWITLAEALSDRPRREDHELSSSELKPHTAAKVV